MVHFLLFLHALYKVKSCQGGVKRRPFGCCLPPDPFPRTSFHCPMRMANMPAAEWLITGDRLNWPGLPLNKGTQLKLSGAASFGLGSLALANSDAVANKSTRQIVSLQTVPALIPFGQRAKNGTRCPPSQISALVPRQGPLAVWSPSKYLCWVSSER